MIHHELWNTLKKMDSLEVTRRSLCLYDRGIKSYKLNIFGRDYLISPEEQNIRTAYDHSEPPVFFLHLAAVNYLIGARDIPLDGRWVREKEFPSGSLFFRGPHEMPAQKILDLYGRDKIRFVSACKDLRGREVDAGDAAFELPVFPRIPVRMVLWLADDEFPARLTYLFDRTANIHLQLDAIWAVGKLIEAFLT